MVICSNILLHVKKVYLTINVKHCEFRLRVWLSTPGSAIAILQGHIVELLGKQLVLTSNYQRILQGFSQSPPEYFILLPSPYAEESEKVCRTHGTICHFLNIQAIELVLPYCYVAGQAGRLDTPRATQQSSEFS